jgi:hypothetical protein
LTFASGDVEGVVHVAVRGDGVVEPDEALSVGLSDPSNAKLGDASAPLTIEDGEPLALAVTSPSVTEGNRGTTPGNVHRRSRWCRAGREQYAPEHSEGEHRRMPVRYRSRVLRQ